MVTEHHIINHSEKEYAEGEKKVRTTLITPKTDIRFSDHT